MKMTANERGIGHIGAIVVVVVLVAVAAAGWFVFKKQNKDSATNTAVSELLASAKCDYDDKDLCKFFTSFKANKYYSMQTTSTDKDGKSTSMAFKVADGKSYTKFDINDAPYETVSIGTTLYTKDSSDGKWWKQTLPATDAEKYKSNEATTLEEPSKDEPEKDKTVYKKIGKEKCGNLDCFKYQVIEPGSDSQTTQFIWFDTKDYQMRRTTTTDKDGNKSDTTFSYDNVSVNAPSPTKDLPAGSYIVPGQSQPVTMPSAGDTPSQAELDALMQQYQAAQ